MYSSLRWKRVSVLAGVLGLLINSGEARANVGERSTVPAPQTACREPQRMPRPRGKVSLSSSKERDSN